MWSNFDIRDIAVVLAVALAASLFGLLAAWLSGRALKQRLAEALENGARTLEQSRTELESAREDLAEQRARLESHAAERAAAEQRSHTAETQRLEALGQTERARARAEAAEMQAALKSQEADEMRRRMAEWETTRTESMNAAKAAVLETAQQVSSKLIADHKRESDAAREDTEKRVTKVTETLVGRMKTVAEGLVTLKDQSDTQKHTLDTVWKALSTPGGAGYYAEIGLENTLKTFGLMRDRDFVLQATIAGKGLRPDAIVFLPGDSVLVVDAKASQFLLHLAEAEGTETEEVERQKLIKTMNEHLRVLAGRDYTAAVLSSYHEAGKPEQVRQILNVMYLPNDGAIEKIGQSDPKFVQRAAQAAITVVGPTALASLVAFARARIEVERQAENHEKIITGTQRLLDATGMFLEHAVRLGSSLKSASKAYDGMAGSLNRFLLPRARVLSHLGVRPSRSKDLPDGFPRYELVEFEENLIDGEAEGTLALTSDSEDGKEDTDEHR